MRIEFQPTLHAMLQTLLTAGQGRSKCVRCGPVRSCRWLLPPERVLSPGWQLHLPASAPAAFRAAEPRQTAPPGPKETWLGEAFVHGEDIRRPLEITHSYPLPEVARAIALYARSNAIIGGKTRVAGLTLKATDTDFSVGTGPLVEGPAISLLLAASGRKSALDELSGPGVTILRERS